MNGSNAANCQPRPPELCHKFINGSQRIDDVGATKGVLVPIYSALFILGFTGNIVTLLVILRNKFLHSKTNFYLCSLAVSDILILISGVPHDIRYMFIPYQYPFGGSLWGSILCITRGLVSETATNASILTIVAFTVDRWCAICKPFEDKLKGNACVSLKSSLSLIWTIAFVGAVPLAYQFGVNFYFNKCTCAYDMNVTFCDVVRRRELAYSFEISSVLFFAIPMCLIATAYVRILRALRISLTLAKAENDSPMLTARKSAQQQIKARAMVIKLLITVCSVFFICFLPFHSQRLLKSYEFKNSKLKRGTGHKEFLKVWYFSSGILYYLSSAVNPLIYSFVSQKFRVGLKLVFATRRNCKTPTKERRYVFKSGSDQKEENSQSDSPMASINNQKSIDHCPNGRLVRIQFQLHRTVCNCSNCSHKVTDSSSHSKDFDKIAEELLKSQLDMTV